MFGKRFDKEYDLVERALENEEGEKFLRAYLKPLVDSVVDTYAKTEKAQDVARDDLYHAAFTHLQMAMKGYKKQAIRMEESGADIFYFTTYFTWFARQGIMEYINSLDKEN